MVRIFSSVLCRCWWWSYPSVLCDGDGDDPIICSLYSWWCWSNDLYPVQLMVMIFFSLLCTPDGNDLLLCNLNSWWWWSYPLYCV
jgi:hypothetical protein